MTLKLYYNPRSRALMTRWLLEEIGVAYELAPVDYEDGSMRTDEFLALNPMGKIPVIVDDGAVVAETVAIAIYLCDKYRTPNNLGVAIDDRRRGEYLRWLVFYSSGVEAAITQKIAGFEMPRSQAGWGSVELVVDVLRGYFAKADPWLMGERFTAVDVVLGGGVAYAMQFGAFPEVPEFTAYTERLMARPARVRADKAPS